MVGLKEYIGANPSLHQKYSSIVVHSKISDSSISSAEYEDTEVQDEFYDAITIEISDEESDDDEEEELDHKVSLNLLNNYKKF